MERRLWGVAPFSMSYIRIPVRRSIQQKCVVSTFVSDSLHPRDTFSTTLLRTLLLLPDKPIVIRIHMNQALKFNLSGAHLPQSANFPRLDSIWGYSGV